MASHGASAAAGSDAPHAEVIGTGQTNPSPYPPIPSGHHSWSSSTGTATVSWNYPVDKPSEDTVYYDPQRDVSVSGGEQNVGSSAPHAAQSTMGMENAAHSHVPYSSSVQHGYNPVEYANYYYSYPQAINDSSVQQGANQHPGAAYQPLTSFQNSGSYIGPTSNTYYNAGGHQTVPGYESSSYYYQNNAWNGGSSGNNYAQSYQNYSSSDANAPQSSTSVPANSLPYQQQYNQWPYYYNHSVPSASSNPVAGNNTTDNIVVNTPSGSSYPSSQPPPPGTTSWKNNLFASVAPPTQAPGVPGPQNQYADQAGNKYNQAAGGPWSQNHYANQAPAYPQDTMNLNHAPPSNPEDQQRTVDSKGPSSNILSINHVSENFQPNLQGSVTTDTSSERKIQIPTNPRIAPGFSMLIPKSEKKKLGAELSKKPAYVSVSMPTNDAKATQVGPDARSIPFSLRNYATRNLNRCKDDAQRAACRSIMEEIMKKAIADGTVLTKNWDTEPLFPLPERVVGMTETSANNSSPFSSTSTPRKHVKSRWEPVVDEKVKNKVEQIAKGLVNNNIHSTSEPKNRMGSSWDHGRFLQARQAPLNKVNQRPVKKQKISSDPSQIENGNVSSDSDKEQDLTKYYASATALANSPEEKKRREHRSKRFEKSQDSSLKSRNSSANKDAVANMCTRRAISSLLTRTCEEGTSLAVEDMDWDALTIKGTCQEIEKRYLRLTSAPDPSTVRPEEVLEKALAMVETSQKNYLYKCDQLKSIRQDLTVQRIQNELTVKVYETHARLAMQAGDLPEYNQCQSQLKRLYAEGIRGCYFEFSAYNLLCVMLHSNNKRDLLSSMASLSKEAKQDGAVKHALAVHAAVLSGNYVIFFKLYKQAPNLNSCLMDLYVERMRFEAMKCMSKSYRPTVPVGYVAQILGFFRTDSEDSVISGDDGSEECEIWLKAHGAILSVDNSGELQIDMKASSATLYLPEPENAVAHGDASLAVNDFLARTS
ncbi:SAC3 family protein A-like isoform X2 [Phragmites australis]|uniref:SAC3 family protein A-like isoform X2 n=1 Tax=Phragmites australis TaxID=29695 RepID=UPI002D764E0B|nr:SAC3 family protein A-like isoform X2 [Phragmites australis]